MSKILYLSFRKDIPSEVEEKVRKICRGLCPSNISAHPEFIYSSQRIIFGISNPVPSITTKKENVLLGRMFEDNQNWKHIGHKQFEGNFTIFRSNDAFTEIVTDYLGTRSTWYYFDEEVFIASTSQKAIIQFLESFEFDERIIPWMISTGSLGPSFCWDRRIKRVPADATLQLNIKSWELKEESNAVEFKVPAVSKEQHFIKLHEALKNTFSNIDIDLKKWAITLSGGHDSRAILSLLKKYNKSAKNLLTITWGKKEALNDRHSDAYIAKILSRRMNTVHEYFATETCKLPLHKVLEDFLELGEGRIDHITGYLDGFVLWKKIFENNIEGIIRGDEVFGYNRILSPMAVNNFMGLTLCSEYDNLEEYPYINSLNQEIPEHLLQKKNETLATWRDRIFQIYRIPYIQSALADLKYPYVEQINPFLTKEIASQMRHMPDDLRTNKKLFKEIMKDFNPDDIPFSKKDSNASLGKVVKTKEFVAIIKEELSSHHASTLFPQKFLNAVISNLKINSGETVSKPQGFFSILKNMIPLRFKKYIVQKNQKLTLDDNLLGYRILIICRMHRILNKNVV